MDRNVVACTICQINGVYSPFGPIDNVMEKGFVETRKIVDRILHDAPISIGPDEMVRTVRWGAER